MRVCDGQGSLLVSDEDGPASRPPVIKTSRVFASLVDSRPKKNDTVSQLDFSPVFCPYEKACLAAHLPRLG